MTPQAPPAPPATDATSFYCRDGERFVPSGSVVSPWNGRSQNGVALAALSAHLIGRQPSAVAMSTTRLTVDILGAVPMAPMTAAVELVRDGSRLQVLAVTLAAEGRSWVRATAMRVRIAATPAAEAPLRWPPPSPAEVAAAARPGWLQRVRRQGDFLQVGPGAQWLRFVGEVVDGMPMTPFERLAIASDFGSGIGALLPVSDWRLANVDISVSATRMPVGEWLLIDSSCESAGNGIGISNARIGDAHGMLATAHQTIFLDPR